MKRAKLIQEEAESLALQTRERMEEHMRKMKVIQDRFSATKLEKENAQIATAKLEAQRI